MRAKVARWNDDLVISLTPEAVDSLGLEEGQIVELFARAPGLEVRPADIPTTTRHLLVQLVARMKPESDPGTLDWGPDQASEIIDDEFSRGEITLGHAHGSRRG